LVLVATTSFDLHSIEPEGFKSLPVALRGMLYGFPS